MTYKMDEMTSASIEHEIARFEDDGGAVVDDAMLNVASVQLLHQFARREASRMLPHNVEDYVRDVCRNDIPGSRVRHTHPGVLCDPSWCGMERAYRAAHSTGWLHTSQ